jgi:flagellin
MAAQRRMSKLTKDQDRENIRLSSGDRIHQASYDPSGLAISNKMESRIRSQQQAQRNINDGVSMIQVAEGTLSSMHEMGSRLLELSLASANDTLGDSERAMIAREFDSTKMEYHRLRESAMFNGKSLMKGAEVHELQVGIDNDPNADRISYDLSKLLSKDFGIDKMGITTKYDAQNTIDYTRKMIGEVSRSRALLGSVSNSMGAALENLKISNENLQNSNSKIRDTDIAKSVAKRAIANINKSATTATLAQANSNPNRVMKLLS